MRNGRTGQYELSQSQMDTVIDKYRLHLPLEEEMLILHSNEVHPGYCHIDVALTTAGEETFYGTFGASAKKLKKRAFLSEVYLFMQGTDTEATMQIADELLMNACCTYQENYENPGRQYELGLLNGYEYMFFDSGLRNDWDKLGYKGVFIVPAFSENVWRSNQIQFFRLIPAYEEELQWVENNDAPETPYAILVRRIAESVPERRCMNVKYPLSPLLANKTDKD